MRGFRVWLLFFSLWCFSCNLANAVTISNINNLHDTDGNTIITGELDVLTVDGVSYFYFNNWGCCLDNNCQSACVYAENHTVMLYTTKDFTNWENRGVVLPLAARKPGIEFRPHVVYNPNTKNYVMWYEDRPTTTERNYAVALSPAPTGPFVTTVPTASFKCGLGGDFDVFVNSDGVAYFIVTHYSNFCIEKLDETFTTGTGEMTTITAPAASEAPVMFYRNSLYYVLFGKSCCACKGGANIWTYTSTTPLGKYTLLGDIGTAPDGSYVTRAQQSAVLEVPAQDGTLQYIWLGNQWGTARDGCYNHDLISWFPLEFGANGTINQLKWQDTISFSTK